MTGLYDQASTILSSQIGDARLRRKRINPDSIDDFDHHELPLD